MPVPARIEDYALIGDLQTCALVSREGSIDWLCLPRFDSPSCFAALLGHPEHGHFSLTPAKPPRHTTRRYLEHTLVLETVHECEEGVVAVHDAMLPRRQGHSDLVRIVEGRRGTVRIRCCIAIRFEYGEVVPWVRRSETGITAVAGPHRLRLVTPVRLRGEGFTTVAEFDVREGERIPFVLSWSPSHEPPRIVPDAFAALEETATFWRRWSASAQLPSVQPQAVLRSLITLKALTFQPTGGIVAAPTTSLPESPGGPRNWDYRYAWIRDSTFTLYALLNAGFLEEAHAWRAWLIRAIAGRPEETQIMYGVAGERRLPELELPWLPGYAGSTPVRVGNAAAQQFQLDIYGEVLDTMHIMRRHGGRLDPDAWRVEAALAEFVCKAWRQPDEGIWEVRGGKRHFTYSKVMAWVALDRAVQTADRFGLRGNVNRWRQERDAVHADVLEHGVDRTRGCFVTHYGSSELDASLLLIPQVGFLPSSDPLVAGTLRAIEEDLFVDGLLRRYRTEAFPDGLSRSEGVFLACSFWLVDAYVLVNRLDEANALFERLCSLRNDVGLLAEEYDPVARRMLGNFPQALSHIALCNSARNLADARGPARHRPAGAHDVTRRHAATR